MGGCFGQADRTGDPDEARLLTAWPEPRWGREKPLPSNAQNDTPPPPEDQLRRLKKKKKLSPPLTAKEKRYKISKNVATITKMDEIDY